VPVPGQYGGDERADLAVFRPTTGTWWIDTNQNGGTDLQIVYGRSGDVPVPGDFDGDGLWDLAIYRRSYGGWFVDTNRNGGTDGSLVLGGGASDVPLRWNGWILDALGITR
jgi:hypothetical protein